VNVIVSVGVVDGGIGVSEGVKDGNGVCFICKVEVTLIVGESVIVGGGVLSGANLTTNKPAQ